MLSGLVAGLASQPARTNRLRSSPQGMMMVRGTLTLPNGTATLPTITFIGASDNTGIYSAAADEITLALNGTRRAWWDSNGIYQTNGAGINITNGNIVGTNYYSRTDAEGVFRWGLSDDLLLGRGAAATLQLGLDAASAIPQTIKGHDGTLVADKAGADLILAGGQSTGAGQPGKLNGKRTGISTTPGSSFQAYNTFALCGLLHVNTVAAGNVGTGEDDLLSYTLPTGMLALVGDAVVIEGTFSFAAAALNTLQLKGYFGSDVFFDSTALALANGAAIITCRVQRTAPTSQLFSVQVSSGNALLADLTTTSVGSRTLTDSQAIKFTATLVDGGGGAANDQLIQKQLTVLFQPAP